ncbi:MAG: tautomerase family protein [Devosia sp.]|jgi:4-oxalocrotonate tautomerase|nr:tautomerase family protein [Devosiaceae bacterium]
MPFVNIRIVKEVIADDPAGKKEKISRGVVETINKTTGIANDDIWVVFEEVDAKDWYVGQSSVAARRKAAGK